MSDKLTKGDKKEIVMIILTIIVFIGCFVSAFFYKPQPYQDEYVEGIITDIDQYVVKSGWGSESEWAIEIDNTTIVTARPDTTPYQLDVGDYVNITISRRFDDRAAKITIIQEVQP